MGKQKDKSPKRVWILKLSDGYAYANKGGNVLASQYASSYTAKRGCVRELGGYVKRQYDPRKNTYRTVGYFMQDGREIVFMTKAKK